MTARVLKCHNSGLYMKRIRRVKFVLAQDTSGGFIMAMENNDTLFHKILFEGI